MRREVIELRRELFDVLCCPACQGDLNRCDDEPVAEAETGELSCSGCQRRWSIEHGVPNLVFPEELGEHDAASRRLWDRIGRFYDRIGPVTNLIRGVSGATERRDLVARLGLTRGSAVLEIA